MRTGDFSASPTIIYDPTTGNIATGAGRTPFPSQMIPANRISPIFQDYMSLLPEPTLPGLANNIGIATDQTKQHLLVRHQDRLRHRARKTRCSSATAMLTSM